ncbi:MAG: ABC transporter substrate-binding protein [Bryobacteraceae bacterium]
MKRLLTVLAVLFVVGAIVTVTSEPVLAGARAGKLVLGVPSLGGEKLDYSRGLADATNTELVRILSRHFIEFGMNGERISGLAESWKPSADAKTWDLVLRKGIKWHNGDTLTGEDVVYGVERMRRPEIAAGTQTAPFLDFLEKVEAVSDTHVRYHFKTPYVTFEYYVNLVPPMPKKYIEKVGDATFDEKPVGTGPFKFVRRIKGSEYEFEAFEDYFGNKPPFKTLIVKIIPENATRLAALKTGEIDIAKDVQGKMLDEVRSTPGLHTTSTLCGAVSYMIFAERLDPKSPWSDVRVRRAAALAIDREAIAKVVFRGEAIPAVFPEGHFAFGMPKDLKPFPYDPAKAKALLAAAGFPNGLPGVWDLQTMRSGSTPFQVEATEAVAGYLAKIGIKTKYQVIEGGAFGAAWKGKKLSGIPVTGSGETRFDLGLKNNVWAARADGWSWLKDEDTNRLWDLQTSTADREKRRQILEEAARTIMDRVHFNPFVETKSIFGLGPKVKEYKLRLGAPWVSDNLENIVLN